MIHDWPTYALMLQRLVGDGATAPTDCASVWLVLHKHGQPVALVADVLFARTPERRGEVERALYPVLLCSAAALGDLRGLRRMFDGGADPSPRCADRRRKARL